MRIFLPVGTRHKGHNVARSSTRLSLQQLYQRDRLVLLTSAQRLEEKEGRPFQYLLQEIPRPENQRSLPGQGATSPTSSSKLLPPLPYLETGGCPLLQQSCSQPFSTAFAPCVGFPRFQPGFESARTPPRFRRTVWFDLPRFLECWKHWSR